MTNASMFDSDGLVGMLVRNGRRVYYGYVDGQQVESVSFSAVLDTLIQARKDGRKVGA